MSWNDTFKEMRDTHLDEYLIRTKTQVEDLPAAE